MNRRILGAAALSAVLAALAPAASLAQPAPPPSASDARDWRRGDPEAMAAQHAERLRALLQLRSDQEPAMRAFLDAVRPPQDMRERMEAGRQDMAQMTTPQRIERMRAMMADHQAAFDRISAATLRFYAQLTPAQQKAFDALRLEERMHGHGKMGHGGHGMMGHGGMRHGGMGEGPGPGDEAGEPR